MNELIQQLMALGPGVVQGLKGNGHAMQAFLQGYHQTQLQMEQQERQKAIDALSMQDHTRSISRQEAQDQRQREADARNLEIQKLGVMPQLAEMGGTAETPDDAKHLIETVMPGLMKAFGQDTMAMGQPAIEQATRTITARQQRQVKEYIADLVSTDWLKQNPDADPIVGPEGSQPMPAHIQKIVGKPSAKLSELQQFAQLPVGKPQSKPSDVPSLQSKELLGPDGQPGVFNFDPKTGQYNPAQGVKPIPPKAPAQSPSGYPPQVLSRISAITKGFDSNPIVKKTQTQAEAVSFADGLDPNTKNPADDQALIYAFAKAMDPDSVVREGEYATVQKYAQSWAESFGFNAQRIFSNTAFLTPQARANMKDTIRARFAAGRGQYENLRNEYGRRIERITGKPGGVDELTDYGGAFPGGEQSAAPKFKPGQKVRNKKTGEVREVTGVRPDGSPILGPVKQ